MNLCILSSNIGNPIIIKNLTLKLNVYTNANINLSIKNINLIIIKHYDNELINIIKKLKLHNNITYEPIDIKWTQLTKEQYLKEMIIFNYVDRIIFSSKYAMNYFKDYFLNKKIYFNYHEYDKRFKIDYSKVEDNVIYIGDISKSSFNQDIFNKYNINHIKSSNNNTLLKNIYYPSIHIDYLLDKNIYYHIHTSTKLSTALNFKSIFICNRIPIYVELLGDIYEYFFKDDLSNLQEIIEKARITINNKKLYKNYLNKVEVILNKLKPESIYNNYISIINN